MIPSKMTFLFKQVIEVATTSLWLKPYTICTSTIFFSLNDNFICDSRYLRKIVNYIFDIVLMGISTIDPFFKHVATRIIAAMLKKGYYVVMTGACLTKAYDVTIHRYRNSHAKIENSKMHILWCMGSQFGMEFQRLSLKVHTKLWTHTLQNKHFTKF